MRVPQLARYNGTVEKAYEFVNENVTQFPIDLFKVIKKLKWKLLTYEELALQNNCTIDDIIDCLGKDGYSIYYGNNYTIAYNNTIKSQGRINFTLAHEIGHIVLNHHKDFDVTKILTDNFTKAEYKILENEANCFARNILVPAPLISDFGLFNMFLKIPTLFNITPKAARARISFLNSDLYYLTEKQINNFKEKYQRDKQCINCSTKHLDINAKYCPLCGDKKLILGDFSMKEYKGINIQELHECPKCENYDLQSKDKYCKICGLKLNNACTACGMEMDTSARYCTECGNVTTYFQSGILSDWKNTTNYKTINNTLNKEFKVFSRVANNDDLPF